MILSITTPTYGRVTIEASTGISYSADLSSLSAVYCFPKSNDEWQRVSPDRDGLALVWTTRFEVHIDQAIGLADRIENAQRTA